VTGDVTAAAANVFTLDFGNVRGGTTATRTFQIANNGSGADIRGALQNTSLGDARLSGNGLVAANFGPILAGANGGDLNVTLTAGNTGGALSGQTLGVVGNFGNVAAQTINLAGFSTVLAQGLATPTGPINLGNFRVGVSPAVEASFTVQNMTSGAGAERLGIASVSANGSFSAVNNLDAGFVLPGATLADAVRIAATTGVAGANSGTLTIQYSSNGQLFDPSFASIAANLQTVALGATGYRLASASAAAPNPVAFAAQRVGGTLTQSLTLINSAANDGFSEGLNVSVAAGGGATASGSIGLLPAGASSSALLVGINTSSSGAKSGTATLTLASDGSGTSGFAPLGLGTQVVNITGNVYAPAVAQLNTTALNFGIVRVGDVVTARNVSVSNTAAGALTDTLRASIGGAAAPFSASGTAATVVAGGTNASNLTVGLNTASAGAFNGSAAVSFTSQNAEMTDLALASAEVALTAQVNNLAAGGLAKTSGAGSFSGGAANYTLNFGTLVEGDSGLSAGLQLTNVTSGPADALAGSFDLSGVLSGSVFTVAGFGDFSGLEAGSVLSGLTVNFGSGQLGTFDQVIVLNSLSTNGSGPDLTLGGIQLHLQGTVVAVPEPGTYLLMIGGLLLLACKARKRVAH